MSSTKIFLHNHSSEYLSGERISGRIECNFNTKKKVKAIRITFVGRAETKWSETETFRNPATNKSQTITNVQYAEETFMNTENNLVEGLTGILSLGSGKHVYPFCHNLPIHLPSSFEGKEGMVQYYIQATVERPSKSNYEAILPFNVVLPMDLNAIPRLRDPVTLSDKKITRSFWCKNSGTLTFKLSLPVTGYIPGQEINIGATIQNTTKITTKHVKFKVVADYEYIVHHPKANSKVHSVVIVKCAKSFVDAQREKSWTSTILLPTDYLYPNLITCNIMNVRYTLKAEVVLPYPNVNMMLEIPITVGSIALSESNTAIVNPPSLVDPNLSQYAPFNISNAPYPTGKLPPPYSAHGEEFRNAPMQSALINEQTPHSFEVSTVPPGFIHSYPITEKPRELTPYNSAPYPTPHIESVPYASSDERSASFSTPPLHLTPYPPSTSGSHLYSSPIIEPVAYPSHVSGSAPYPIPPVESASYPPLNGSSDSYSSESEELEPNQKNITAAVLPPPYEQSQQ